MSMKEETVCRVCLNVADKEFEVIDEVTREIFDVLLLEMNLDVNDNAVICHQCSESAKKSFYFKSVCIDTEKCVMLFAINKPEGGFEMKDIYEKKNVEVVDKNFNICRFCMNLLEKNNFISVASLMEEVTVAEMSIFLPEMDPLIVKNYKACSTCRDNFKRYFKLACTLLDTEMKLCTYYQYEGTNDIIQGKLSNKLQHFLFGDMRDCVRNKFTQRCLIEQETDIFGEIEKKCFKVDLELIKVNELDIKDEVTPNEDCKSSLDMLNNCDKQYKGISTEKVHNCTLCSYVTKYKSCLNRHIMLIHKDISEIKTYKCTECTFEAKRKRNVIGHMLTHKNGSQVKKYECLQCTFTTKYRNGLQKHMLVHNDVSEVKMFKCTQCTFETKHQRNLKNHIMTHKDISEVNVYKCAACSYVSKYKGDLKKHIMAKHKHISEIGKV